MNIYALKGHKVKAIAECSDYYCSQKDTNLTIEAVYTVKKTTVCKSYTCVDLEEFEGVSFNSILFEDIDSQTQEDDKKHPDWENWDIHRFNDD